MNITFSVDGKEYEAHLDRGYITTGKESCHRRDRRTATCILISLPDRAVNAGATVCHPSDDYDIKRGYQIAFKRALAQRYIVDLYNQRRSFDKIHWLKHWHKFRKAFGQALHEQYDEQTMPF